MTKKSITPVISDKELNSLLGRDEPCATTSNDTELTPNTDDSEKKTIPEPVVRSEHEVVSASTVPVAAEIPSESTALAGSELPSTLSPPVQFERPSAITTLTAPDPIRRPSTKQRKASFDEYRETFLRAPKISDRQPVFLSRTTRDRIDEIVRRLGNRKMSVSGFLENLAQQHLEAYSEDIEVWKRL